MTKKNSKIKVKRGKLSNVEKVFIEVKRDTLSISEIAAELERAEKIVASFIKELPPKTELVAVEPPKLPSAIDEMCPKDNDGESRGIAIMSEGTSTKADDFYKDKIRSKVLPHFRQNIHKPKTT